MAQPSWIELQQIAADRLREAEDISGAIPEGEPDIPYYGKTIIENALLEASAEILCEIPAEELEALGSDALVTTVVNTSGIVSSLPLNMLKVASVTIQPKVTDTEFVSSQPLPPALFIANGKVDPALSVSWSIFTGALHFTGYRATLVSVVLPPLSLWRAPAHPILPDGYSEEQIDRAVKQLQIENFEPQGGE